MHYSQGDFCYPPCCIIPTVTVGSTVTTPPGTRARVTASPTPCGVELDFAIPRGNPGPAGTRGPTGPQGSGRAGRAAGSPGTTRTAGTGRAGRTPGAARAAGPPGATGTARTSGSPGTTRTAGTARTPGTRRGGCLRVLCGLYAAVRQCLSHFLCPGGDGSHRTHRSDLRHPGDVGSRNLFQPISSPTTSPPFWRPRAISRSRRPITAGLFWNTASTTG